MFNGSSDDIIHKEVIQRSSIYSSFPFENLWKPVTLRENSEAMKTVEFRDGITVAISWPHSRASRKCAQSPGDNAEVKAYGSAEEIAKDPEIDLVVISVIAPKHYDLTKPLLLAKKDVFVEWPLAANTAEYEELADLAKLQNVKGIVGTQACANRLVVKTKEFINSGRIGTVLSSTVSGYFMSLMRLKVPDSIKYHVDKDSGGNNLTIFYGHFLDSFIHVLGNFKQLQAISKTSYPTVDIISKDGTVLIPNYPKTAPRSYFCAWYTRIRYYGICQLSRGRLRAFY
ncbi:hypothetical protein EYC80_002735 [Monilinia laxa]|uniref:Uncharacterized protein n=1 Tax=Monilinia laxa TaxID=61186 RepID=A0A5N6K4R6_MONLA|nr:hypothetical protein EYC80_002735 [Monilinia laxa]